MHAWAIKSLLQLVRHERRAGPNVRDAVHKGASLMPKPAPAGVPCRQDNDGNDQAGHENAHTKQHVCHATLTSAKSAANLVRFGERRLPSRRGIECLPLLTFYAGGP